MGLSAPRLERLVEDGAIAMRPAASGRAGVMKDDLLAWHRDDLAARRVALVALAALIDREVFG